MLRTRWITCASVCAISVTKFVALYLREHFYRATYLTFSVNGCCTPTSRASPSSSFEEGNHMASCVRFVVQSCLVLACLLGAALAGAQQREQSEQPFDTSAPNLLAVLRESRGENKQDE